ncbi:MAG: D-alanine--D-alanine ligase [Desulfobacterales bacterium]
MNIGLTFDLRSEYLKMGYSEDETAEFDRDDTITAIENALHALGQKTDRIGNARQLMERLVNGDRWDLVFNIAEGLKGFAREAQVPAILDLYEIPYTFSDPLVMSLSLHKAFTKQVVKDYGCPTPAFAIVNHPADTENISFDPPFFIKPLAEGTGKGITEHSIFQDHSGLPEACGDLIDRYQQPVLVEKYLSGREFTVGILGTGQDAQILGTLEVHLLENAEKGVYSYANKENCETCVQYLLVSSREDTTVLEAETVALAAWRALGCRDGGRVDLRCDEKGTPHFLEVNPLAGLHPHHSDLPILCNHLGIPYLQLIHRILTSASMRVQTIPNTASKIRKCV